MELIINQTTTTTRIELDQHFLKHFFVFLLIIFYSSITNTALLLATLLAIYSIVDSEKPS